MASAEEAVLQLSAEARLRLIERLWESLVEERGDQIELLPEVRAEIQRRVVAHRLAPDQTLTWAEVEQLLEKAE